MKILISAPIYGSISHYFPQNLIDRLSALGEIIVNKSEHRLSRENIIPLLADTDIVLTHWGSITYDEEILNHAPKLKLIAHCAGSVGRVASEASYDRGIPVLSANPIMAKYVAEWVLGTMIVALREFPAYDKMMREGKWRTEAAVTRSLFYNQIGLIGLGAVGRNLLDMLRPFGCKVKIYDPYIKEDSLSSWENASLVSFEEAMSQPVVSIHASKTPETYHMINADALSLIPDGGLLINSARGSLIHTEALIEELEGGRISAALDVFEEERVPQDARLLSCPNVILAPHTASLPAGDRMTEAIIDDIERFCRGEELRLAVSREQFRRMTRE